MGNYDETLGQLRQKIASKQELMEKLENLRAKRSSLNPQVQQLRADHQSEQADVDKLQGKNLTSIFLQTVGKLDDKLEKERREASDAKAKLYTAERELETLDSGIRQIEEQLKELSDCERDYAAALEARSNAEKSAGSSVGAEIIKIEEQIDELERRKADISQTIQAGGKASSIADDVLTELDGAEEWSDRDIIGFSGGIFGNMAKHEHLDEAQAQFELLLAQLEKFKTGLGEFAIPEDTQINVDSDLRFADRFIGGIFADLKVADHISQSQDTVEGIKNHIQKQLEDLNTKRGDIDRQLSDCSRRIEDLLVGER